MIVNSPRIFGGKDKFFTMKSKVLKRRKKPPQRKLRNVSLVVIVVMILIPALIFGGYRLVNALLVQSRFMVEEISIEGNEYISAEAIRAAAGVTEGDNLFGFDIYDVKRKIERMPQIHAACVDRELPGSVTIRVQERRARAIIEADTRVCVDATGILLPEEASGGIDDMTRIYGIQLGEALTGKMCENENLSTVLYVLKLRDSSELRAQVRIEAVSLIGNGDIRISAREQGPKRRLYTIYLGRGKEELPQRMADLAKVLTRELGRPGHKDRIINMTYRRPTARDAENS